MERARASLKVAHCVGWYFPESTGGSEVYVANLCRGLRAEGIEACVLAPVDGHAGRRYEHDGIEVIRYPVPVERTAAQHDGHEPPPLLDTFRDALRACGADVYHQHSLTYGCSQHHLRVARALGLRCVITPHIPNFICERGTMMAFGTAPCDGRITVERCGACVLQARRVPEPLARAVAPLLHALPAAAARAVPGKLGTALRLPEHVRMRASILNELGASSERVVAVSEWIARALENNGMPRDKLVTLRQGIEPELLALRSKREPQRAGSPLRVGFFGRAAAIKGIDVLIDAVHEVPPDVSLTVAIHGLATHPEDKRWLDALRARCRDPRVRFLDPVPHARMPQTMLELDVVAVPSRWLETGPLIAMEALALGIPVLGSDLGGIAELIRPGKNGWLAPYGDVTAWAALLMRLAKDRSWQNELQIDVVPPLTTDSVARVMAELYRSLSCV